ncbi:alpha/beta hydrolase [Flammeovirga sp. MY04]|uniref:alpha/beta hydrolase n=1 Tax=Flammeovirga sp. MY04 TaxID=1191459 RepID=UPI00080610F7|nr:alpha/beta hydrolase [Flammeovirga sp. MY04]ANQ50696.1 alpha/beta hydrolase [Flammeovirga sp. MY04]
MIHISPQEKKHKNPIILIHGALFNGKLWEGNFLDYFPEQGYETYSINLSGHGQEANKLLLNFYGIDDFVDDVVNLITSLEEKPILFGYSMGGIVAQLVAQKVSLHKVVLLASVPPYGMLNSSFKYWTKSPLSWGKFMASTVFPILKYVDSDAPEGIYHTAPSKRVQRFIGQNMQSESLRALVELIIRDFKIDPKNIELPMIHIGFKSDQIIFPEEVKRTASFYGHEVRIFDEMAHMFMYEPRWKEVAEFISKWLLDDND